ncbi:uncharacterized protein [Periplaneta americana]|uniref:uncharacterized protein isoform X1 n=2 Tax=Periplaneta americana TaxID=6978 RepID=UPI0037E795DD
MKLPSEGCTGWMENRRKVRDRRRYQEKSSRQKKISGEKFETEEDIRNEPRSEGEDKSDPLLEEGRQCNPSLPVEMLNDADRMRGDAIGNTLYSECWVLKILMKLTKVTSEEWSEDMETELCLLWDMTIEPDVVELLVHYNFLGISSQLIREVTVPRLTEILVGIIGNMSCTANVRAEIAQSDVIISALLGLLSIPDVPTLLQLMRLLQACFWDLRKFEEKSSEDLQNVPESKVVTSDSNCSLTKSCDASVVGNEHNVCDNTKGSEHKSTCSENDSVKNQTDNSHCEQSCAMDFEYSVSDSCTLSDSNKSSVRVPTGSHMLNVDEDICDIDLMNNRTKDHTLSLRDEVNKQKNEVGSKWLKELCDMNKWFPNIIFILKSSINEELLRGTLSFLETLCYIPINNHFLAKYISTPEIVEALLETLNQIRQEYKKDGDIRLKTEYEKAVCHWASILSAFTSYPEGKTLIGNYGEALCESICNQLVVDELQLHFDENQAEFVMLTTTIVNSLLQDSGYFYPPIFNCFLSVLTLLREKNGLNEEEDNNTSDFASREILQEVINSLEKYFEDVVQYADAEALSRVLQHCNRRHVAILQSVMEGQNKFSET